MPKDKVIEYWSGNKLRYRKDGKLDQRYKLAKEKIKERQLVGKDVKKKPVKKARSNLRGWLRFYLILVLAGILTLVAVALGEWLLTPRELISPLGKSQPPIAHAQEAEITHEDICEKDYVTREICKYDWDANIMIAIAKAENGYRWHGWREDAFNINDNDTIDAGIFQINSVHGYSLKELVNHESNIKAAYEVWLKQGYNAWVAYWNGAYKEYLQ